MAKNIIFVDNFETPCLIGIYPREKIKKQNIRISVKLEIKKIIRKDSASSTVSYDRIIERLKKIKNQKHVNLVETLAYNLYDDFSKIKNIKHIEVKIIKCDILSKNCSVGFLLEKSVK